MTPSARIQATIELLEELFEKKYPADNTMAYYFKQRRYIGSKDKAAISEQFYHILRNKLSLEYLVCKAKVSNAQATEAPSALENGDLDARSLVIAYLISESQTPADFFGKDKYAPSRLTTQEQDWIQELDLNCLDNAPQNVRLNIPQWIEPRLKEILGAEYESEALALGGRAATDIRVNSLKAGRQSVLALLHGYEFECDETRTSPLGIRFKQRVGLFGLKEFRQGLFEVQDEGSQLLGHLVHAKAKQKVVDFCAGAGGKTLAMAADMTNQGALYACDVHGGRLEQLKKRTKRAGVHNVRIQHLSNENDRWVNKHSQFADTVLIDAPCSGTGTWRRSPDARWNLDQGTVDELVEKQKSVLSSASRLVKPGGQLFYATCSLLKEENEDQIEWFVEQYQDFQLGELDLSNLDNLDRCVAMPHQLRTFAARSDMDGFYVCVLRRRL